MHVDLGTDSLFYSPGFDVSKWADIQTPGNLQPENLGRAIESGISSGSLSEFRWIGKGPYVAYPGKDKLSEFGIYHVNKRDLYFTGNRQALTALHFQTIKEMVLRSLPIRPTYP